VYQLTGLGEAALLRWPDIMHPAVSEGLARQHENVVSGAAANVVPIARTA
jgi:hypothetical protein